MQESRGNIQILSQANSMVKRTWRLLFRIVTLILLISIFVLSLIIVLQSTPGNLQSDVDIIRKELDELMENFETTSKSLLSVANQITYDVSVLTPIRQEATETNIIAKIKDHCKDRVVKGESTCTLSHKPLHDASFLNGFNKFYFTYRDNVQIRLNPLLDYPNFIPTATTPHGCIRIPSFSLSQTHWCYTHNTILRGCEDTASSKQYVSLGTLQTLENGDPYFKVEYSHYLNDRKNRKSCSVVAVLDGCLLYCVIMTKNETENFKDPQLATQLLTYISYNGTIKERIINPPGSSRDWVHISPGVGSGILYSNYIIFPLYGGLMENSMIYNNQSGKYFFPNSTKLPCSNKTSEKITGAKDSYTITYFSKRLIQSAFLICDLRQFLSEDCEILIPSNDHMLVGAEGRLYNIENNIFYYQRGSSWWPYPSLYRIKLNSNKKYLRIIEVKFTKIEIAPRPGNKDCPGNKACPKECITGVYQDIWPLSYPNTAFPHKKRAYYTGFYLNNSLARRNPTFYTADNLDYHQQERLGKFNLTAGYSTTTCFKQTTTARLYCLYILEVGDSVIGDFQIFPFLRSIDQAIT